MTLAELERVVRENVTGNKHFDGCEAVHGWCAAKWLLVELRAAKDTLQAHHALDQIDARLEREMREIKSASLRLKMPGVKR